MVGLCLHHGVGVGGSTIRGFLTLPFLRNTSAIASAGLLVALTACSDQVVQPNEAQSDEAGPEIQIPIGLPPYASGGGWVTKDTTQYTPPLSESFGKIIWEESSSVATSPFLFTVSGDTLTAEYKGDLELSCPPCDPEDTDVLKLHLICEGWSNDVSWGDSIDWIEGEPTVDSLSLKDYGNIEAFAFEWVRPSGPLTVNVEVECRARVEVCDPTDKNDFRYQIELLRTFTAVDSVDFGAPTIQTTSLPAGDPGESYSEDLEANGGSEPYSWSIVAGALPSGLSLGESTGVIYGTPSKDSTWSFTARVDGASGRGSTKDLSITIQKPPTPDSLWVSAAPLGLWPTLSWTATSPSPDHYSVERRVDGGTWGPVGTTSSTSYPDYDILVESEGTGYKWEYQVRAIVLDADSNATNVVEVWGDTFHQRP